MGISIMHPKKCRKFIMRISDETGASYEDAYAMMLLMAALMDLKPDDDEVVSMILQDCGIEDMETA